ncbi:ATP-binding cassette domain-containing protein [Bittarella massiliensis (ex Durand et al. 2017)]|uniref:ATP-binding cassette domain-containing protein n=1 Tax=Bittarella massiliensis (ex Durand et al. 2017) TaxID=1720313 RepID=UPI0034A03D3E
MGPQGANLSGGRRQRLALARALLHGTPIYIFDEATSNSDVGSENDIIAEIHALAGEKTVLLVSHRPANVAAADCICVPGPGRGPPSLLARMPGPGKGGVGGRWGTVKAL